MAAESLGVKSELSRIESTVSAIKACNEPVSPEYEIVRFEWLRSSYNWAALSLTALFLGAHDQLPKGSPILGLLWPTTRLTSKFSWDPKPVSPQKASYLIREQLLLIWVSRISPIFRCGMPPLSYTSSPPREYSSLTGRHFLPWRGGIPCEKGLPSWCWSGATQSGQYSTEVGPGCYKTVLLDAVDQKKKSQQVEDWLEKLQDVLYDIDDLLDDFITEDKRQKLVVIKGSKWKKVRNFFSCTDSLVPRVTMSCKLKKIRSRLEDIDADRKKFQCLERVLDIPVVYPLREQTHSYVHTSDVFGRDYDKNRIIELLLSSASPSASSKFDNFDVILEWMAQGLIQSSNSSQQIFDSWNQYFHELQSRSFFQCEHLSFDNAVIQVKMHDLVHDLALSVAGKEVSHVNYDTRNIFRGTRHLLFSEVGLEGKEFPHFLLKLNKIIDCEKLNLLEEEEGMMMELPRGLLSLGLKQIPKLKELPRGFENAAASIKYIKINDCSSFEILPEWLMKCTSLLKLVLENCTLLESLPLRMHQLTTLRHLCIRNCSENLKRKCERETVPCSASIELLCHHTTTVGIDPSHHTTAIAKGAMLCDSFPDRSYIKKETNNIPPKMKPSFLPLSYGCEAKQPILDEDNSR
ncbi:hypothetical protein LguiA_026352 [Lonicera macranthoides]